MAENLESVTPVELPEGWTFSQTASPLDVELVTIQHALGEIRETVASFDRRHSAHLSAIEKELADLRQGVTATYTGVDWLIKMLSGVQQMAANMPGITGKFMRKFAGDIPLTPEQENHHG